MSLCLGRVNAFLLRRPLSTMATGMPRRRKYAPIAHERGTLCRSATAEIPFRESSRTSRASPIGPEWRPFQSAMTHTTLGGHPLNSWSKGACVSIRTRRSGYCRASEQTTGTVMATSPKAEVRMTRMERGSLSVFIFPPLFARFLGNTFP